MRRFIGGWARKPRRQIPIQTLMDLAELGYESVKTYRRRAAIAFDEIKSRVGLSERGDDIFSVTKVDAGYAYEFKATVVISETIEDSDRGRIEAHDANLSAP